MTRQEVTGTRDLTFSGWIREHLPDSSTGFLASDLDFILWNWKTRRLMLIEVKTRGAKMRFWQESLFKMFDNLILIGAEHLCPAIEYRGFHCIRFENTSFDDGRVYFDDTLTTEMDLINVLGMSECER